jgi:hypothetical protein
MFCISVLLQAVVAVKYARGEFPDEASEATG